MKLCDAPPPDLPFESIEAETNFYCVIGLINFGSGYRLELMAANGRGASDSIVHGTKALHQLAKGCITAEFLSSLSVDVVSKLYLMDSTPLLPLATKIHAVLTAAGVALQTRGHASFFSFVYATLTHASTHCKGKEANAFVTALIETFPALQDRSVHQGKEVWILKKPQLLAIDLYRHLNTQLPQLFAWGDRSQLTVFADNVLPVLLRHFGVLRFEPSLAEIIDTKQVLPPDEREVEIRALSVHACNVLLEKLNEHLIRHSRKAVDATQLDFYLWFTGRAASAGWPERHYTKDTIFY